MPKILRSVHLAVLQKFVYRLTWDLDPETRTRLEGLVATYTRLYV
jgi:hypothetical protein